MTKPMVTTTIHSNTSGTEQDIVDAMATCRNAASIGLRSIFDDCENPFASSPNFTKERIEADYNLTAQLMFSRLRINSKDEALMRYETAP